MADHPLAGLENDIPHEAAYRAHTGTSFDPDHRAEGEQRQYTEHLTALWKQLDEIAETDHQKAVAVEQFTRYREGLCKRWLDMLAARSRIVSPMIAGPANFPVRQMEKRRRSLDNRMRELTGYAERIRGKAIEAVKDAAPADKKRRDEVETYKRRIMRSAATVAAIDKGEERGYDRSLFVASVAGKIERLANRDLAAAQELLTWLRDEVQPKMPKPLFTARHKVWTILDRVPPEPVEAKPSEDIEGEAATLTINHERGGVELTFPNKPDEGVRSRLKAAGFRWSGRQGLWYARANERTLAVAREIAGT